MRVFYIVILFGTFIVRGAELSEPTIYTGMCDASAAVSLGNEQFVVADDEDNALRVYHATNGGPALKMFDPSRFLRVDPNEAELDLEGAARVENRIYWMTSHGRNKNAKYRDSRVRFFATEISETSAGEFDLRPVGQYYSLLLVDILTDARLARFNLAAAAQLPPKARGGFNIESLSATSDGKLLLGFRNPIPQGRALIVPLLNPQDVISGKRAALGEPVLLDLRGRGVRAMTLHHGRYIVLAGSYDGSSKPDIYLWDGKEERPPKLKLKFGSFNPEAIVVYPTRKDFQIISDDGTVKINRVDCKQIKDPRLRRFRGAWVMP